jgi:cytochrome c1
MSLTIRTGTIIAALATALVAGPALAAGEAKHPHAPEEGWSFSGVFGHYEDETLQRGFHVFESLCSTCHSLDYVAFRNLAEPGGPGFTMDQVRAIAAQYQVPTGPNEFGEILDEFGLPLTREATPADRFPAPYPNAEAARAAQGGALPPDLSLITKARVNGPSYVYSLLTGFEDAPEGTVMQPGMNYNPYFSNGQIAMAAPLYEGALEYADGTEATVEQMAYDVTNFLMWAAEPKLEKRKRLGFQVMLFLAFLAALLYWSYRKIWASVEH